MSFSPEAENILKQTLIENKLLSEQKFIEAQKYAEKEQKTLVEGLLEKVDIPEEKLASIIAKIFNTEFIKPTDRIIQENILNTIPLAFAESQNVIVFDRTETEIKIATPDPQNQEIISFVEKKSGLPAQVYYTTPHYLREGLKLYNRDVNQKFNKLLEGALKDPSKIESLEDASKILDTIIAFAAQSRASDIHIEPQAKHLLIRYRIDGILQDIVEIPKQIEDLLITRIKVLANMRTDEHRSAQDGRFKINLLSSEITLRVSIIPVYEGEKAVMRILAAQKQSTDLEDLGFSKYNLEIVENNVKKKHGIILVTGPTGSGKTTTLYTILKKLNSREVNIETIEDPIEYQLPGISQIQVNNKTNLTFGNGLRALLRQDPDIIMVGEIRDEETASIAINAALTGHLVLATLHTNSAAATLPRITEMGVETFLSASTINMALAQRLLRVICQKCKEAYEIDLKELLSLSKKIQLNKRMIESLKRELGFDENTFDQKITLYRGKGCSLCGNSGFRGRLSIAEVIDVDSEIKQLILKNASPDEIEENAIKKGMRTMFQDGIEKALQGLTSIEEVLRVIRE